MKKTPVTHLFQLVCIIACLLASASPASALPIYWDTNGSAAGAGGASPAGSWNGASSRWSTSPFGDGAAGTWLPGATAVFAAGTDATGSYTVTVGSALSASGLVVEEGFVTLNGTEVLTLTGDAVVDVQSSSALILKSPVAGTAGLKKSGNGGLLIDRGNNFSGNTIVNQGVLAVSNPSGSATGSGDVLVGPSGILKGSGIIGGKVNLQGNVSPGNSPGTLTTGSETWGPGAGFHWEINDALGEAGTEWDLIQVNGSLTINATALNPFNITLNTISGLGSPSTLLNFDNTSAFQWTLVKTTGGISNFVANKFNIITTPFMDVVGSGVFRLALSPDGKDLVLHFGQPPIITANPLSLTNVVGTTATFVVGATASAPLSYSWKFNGAMMVTNARISGVNSHTLVILNTQEGDEGVYTCEVSSADGVATAGASLSLLFKPRITLQPLSQTNNAGVGASFTVGAIGGQLTYQWKKGSTLLADGSKYSGSQTPNLQIYNLKLTDAGSYSVLVSNLIGFTNSVAAKLVINDPAINIHPFPAERKVGASVTFTVQAAGTATLLYQWQKDGVNVVNGNGVSGATSSSLTISSISAAHYGVYRVKVQNSRGVVTSLPAALTPSQAPTIVSDPEDMTKPPGGNGNLSVTVTGTPPFSYQWYKDGSPLSNSGTVYGVSGPTLSFWNMTAADAGEYHVTVSNEVGSVISETSTVTISNEAPSVVIVNPTDGGTAPGPANANITANAFDSDGSIERVEFYVNGNLIETDYSAPYNSVASNIFGGTYTITAQAYDNLGLSTESEPVTFVVAGDCNLVPNGAISWWRGDDGAYDFYDRNNGGLYSDAETTEGGFVGSGLAFNGIQAVMAVPHSSSLSFPPGSRMTVELWAYRTGPAAVGRLIGKRTAVCGAYNYELSYDESGQTPGLRFGGDSGSGFSGVIVPQSLPIDGWMHLAGTYDGNTFRLYINGVLAGSAVGSLGSTNLDPLKIGGSGGCDYFQGTLDEIAIYNRALSDVEIQQIYGAGSFGKCDSPLKVAAASYTGGPGNQRATGVAIAGGSAYLAGYKKGTLILIDGPGKGAPTREAGRLTGADDEGLVARFNLPLENNSALPMWSTTWPGLPDPDRFNSVSIAQDGLYVAGESFGRTADGRGDKEGKGMMVKFPFVGPNGSGFGGSVWDKQTPPFPGAFSISGKEVILATTVSVEGGVTYIYATGYGEANSGNSGRQFVTKVKGDSTVIWTVKDESSTSTAFSSGNAITVMNGHVYVAGRSDDEAGTSRAVVSKYTLTGALEWAMGRDPGVFNGIANHGGSLYLVGQGDESEILWEKRDEAGSVIWSFKGESGSPEGLNAVIGFGNRIYAAGWSRNYSEGDSEAILVEIDPETGEIHDTQRHTGPGYGDTEASGIATDGVDLYVSGETATALSGKDAMLLRFKVSQRAIPLVIASTLPSGEVGKNYVSNLQAVGGKPPYSWSIVSGALPSGLSLTPNGKVSGTPLVDGISSVTVRVTDSSVPAETANTLFSVSIIPSNDVPVVTITSPSQGASFGSPATFEVSVSASDRDSINRVDISVGDQRYSLTSPPYDATVSGLSAGTYEVRAYAQDSFGGIGQATPIYIRVNEAGTYVLDFEAVNTTSSAATGSAVSGYFAGPRINITNETAGASFVVDSSERLGGGNAVIASSGRNVFTHTGINGRASYTIGFPSSVGRFEFTRVKLLSGLRGITHPSWRATAFDASGNELSSVSEDLITSYLAVPAQSYNLYGPDIRWIRIEGDNRGVASFTSALLDDFILHDEVGNYPPSVAITDPVADSTFSAPANVTVSATAYDADGYIDNIKFYKDNILMGASFDNPGSITLSNLAPGVYFVKAVATDDLGATRSSQLARFVVNAAAGISMINFDGLDASARNVGGSALASYLAQFGVTITGPTLGSRVEAADFRNLAGGSVVSPSSPRNVLGQVGVSGPMAYTLRFEGPLQSVKFTRPLLKGGSLKVSHPAWRARAFNLAGTELATVEESEISSFEDVPARNFELRAPGIAWVRFESEGGRTTFSSVLIDDLVLNSNTLVSLLSVNIVSPAQNSVFTAPADILIRANLENAEDVSKVEFYAGTTLIGLMTEGPFDFNWQGVLAGSYGLRSKVFDNEGKAAWSGVVNITVEPGAGGNSKIVNFDAVDASGGPVSGATLESYLGDYGISLSAQTAGTTVQAVAQTSFLSGNTVKASSEPNVLTQTGAADSMDFTLDFAEPLQSLQFTRPKLRAGSVGITHPQWTARAFDGTDTEVASVSEAFISSYSDVAPSVFVLQGQGITKVKFESNNRRTTAFKAVLLDDFILTTVTTNLPPVVKITEPGDDNIYVAPASVNLVAEALDYEGEVARVDFFNGVTLIGSATNEPYSILWTNVPVGRYTLRAVAYDDENASRNSETVRITVVPRENVFGFLTHPSDQTVGLGDTATFSATTTFSSLTDGPLVTYQWTFDGDNIADATNSTLVLQNISLAHQGAYALTATSGGIDITSDSANLTVATAPVIETQPEGQSVNLGSSATFSVEASGAAPLRYQWVRNGNPIANATSSTLELNSVKSTDAGNYAVIVANAVGSVRSDKANLSVVISNGALSTADDFDDRISFNPLVSPVFGNNTSATSESGEPDHARKTGGKSIWYTWRASFTGVITLTTLGSGFDTLLGVYTGNSVDSLSQVAANDDARDGYFTSQVTFYIIEGVDYHIAVDGFFGAAGDVTLSMPDGGYRVLSGSGSDEELPLITTQPEGRSVVEGADHTLTVGVSSQTALNYQWFFNGLPITDATNSSLEIEDFDSGAVGRYYVLVANDVGSVESDIAQLQIVSAEVENVETVSSKDKFLESIASGITASAGRPHKVPVGNAGPSRGYTTTQILSTVGSTKEDGEPNHAGEPGGASEWYVYAAPESGTMHINTDGSSFNTVLAVYTGSGFGFDTLTTVASNNGSSGNGGDRVRFAATQDTIYFIAVDGVGGASGTVKLNINLGTPPSITAAPATKVTTLGSSAVFTVTATGTTNLSYQWKFNGANISGATGSSYTRSNIQLNHFGAYTVVVSNMINTASNSPAAYLQIESAPIITAQPTSRTVVAGTNSTLSVSATGTAPLRYQWRFNDMDIASATNSSLVLSGIQTTNLGAYTVRITNIVGVVTSDVATVSVNVPAPVITSHLANAVVSNGSIVLAGTAPGNARIIQIQTKLNDGSFSAATGITSWSKNLTLVPGTNTITVKAIDSSAFEATTERKIFYSALYTFTLHTNGIGHVTNAPMSFGGVTYRAVNGAQLVVDKTYKLTATQSKTGPGTNYIFTNWTDHANQIIGTNSVLNYVMTTNGHVNANFITNPFIATAGTYSGLFYETNGNGVTHATAGMILLKATSKLGYSGKLFLDGDAVSFSGKFALPGTAVKTVLRSAKYGKPDLTIEFALDFTTGSDQIVGTLSDGTNWVARIQADRAVWTLGSPATAYTNSYVIAIPPSHANPALGPVGYGYGLMSVDALGKVKLAGGAGDTHLLKQGTFVSKDGLIPFYVPLYVQSRTFNDKVLMEYQGSMMGWLTLEPNTPAGKAHLAPQGDISWIKTGWTNAFYPGGFTNELTVLASRHLAPAAGVRMLSLMSGTASLSSGNLLSPINVGFNIGTDNVFKTNSPNPQVVTVSAAPKTGGWKGLFTHPQNPAIKTKYFGAFLQDYDFGVGHFAGTNQTGLITFE